MSKMNYFRRPLLVGNSLRRPPTPSIRGNRRRKNADSSQALPYFDGLPANGGTLELETTDPVTGEALPVSITVAASTVGIVAFSALLADINSKAAMTSAALVAFDADGCLGFRTSQASFSANVYVKLTGGTAATALGFNINEHDFISMAGDQPSAPEGRIGNPFDAVLPPPGESLTTETFTRPLGRIMANSDVLFSELMREEIVYKKIGTASGPSSTIDLGDIAPGQKVFTDGGPSGGEAGNILNSTSTPGTLTRFFFLVDRASGKQSRSAIVGVTHHNGNQALGTEKQVLQGDILEIPNGRVVKIGNTAGAQVGDYAKITGATNRGWSNNGYRWVVEEVMDDGLHLALRPMSAQELRRVNETGVEHHPYVELCVEKESGGSYGTLTLFKGPFSDDITFTVSPALVSGQSVDVWAAVPSSFRDRPVDTLSAPSFTPYTPYITVGASGDFQDLARAISWVSTSPGSDAVEIVLLESQTAPAGGYLIPQPLVIRGAIPGVVLNGTSGYLFSGGTTDSPTVQLVNLNLSASVPLCPSAASSPPRIILTNVAYGASQVAGVDSNYDVDIGAKAASVNIGKTATVTNVRGFLTAASYIQAGGMTGAPGARLGFDGSQGFLMLGKSGEQDVNLTKDHVDLLVGGPGSDAQSLHKHQDLVTGLATETATRAQADTTLQAHIDAEATTRAQADLDIRNWADGRYLALFGGGVVLGNVHIVPPPYEIAFGVDATLGISALPSLTIHTGNAGGEGQGTLIAGEVRPGWGYLNVHAYSGGGSYGTLRLGDYRYVDGVGFTKNDNVEIRGNTVSIESNNNIDIWNDINLNSNTLGTINWVKDPVNPNQVANKAYVDARVGSGGTHTHNEAEIIGKHKVSFTFMPQTILGGENGDNRVSLAASMIGLTAGTRTLSGYFTSYMYTGWDSGTHEIYAEFRIRRAASTLGWIFTADTVLASTYRTCGAGFFQWEVEFNTDYVVPETGRYWVSIVFYSSWGSWDFKWILARFNDNTIAS